MERILVSMEARQGAWKAWSRAVSLAKRIDARVYALLVLPSTGQAGGVFAGRDRSSVRKRLELLIESAKSDGIRIDYFISEGDYEEEVIEFVDQNRISLLVAESADGESRQRGLEGLPIRKILHRAKCRVELISSRKIEHFRVRKGNGHGYSTASVSADRRK